MKSVTNMQHAFKVAADARRGTMGLDISATKVSHARKRLLTLSNPDLPDKI